MAVSATMPTQVAASVVVQPVVVVAVTLVAPATVVVLITVHPVAISVTSSPALSSAANNPALMHAKKAAVSKPLGPTAVAVTVLSNAQRQHTHGTVVITAALHVKMHARKAHVKALAAGKSAVVTTATPHVQHLVALQGTSLHGVQNHSAQALSSPTLQAKALLANAAVHAC